MANSAATVKNNSTKLTLKLVALPRNDKYKQYLPSVQVQVCHGASISRVAPSVTCAPVLASENKIS
jgi:hypothetical protein